MRSRTRAHHNAVPSVQVNEHDITGRNVIDIPLLWDRKLIASNGDRGAVSQVPVICLDAVYRNVLQNKQTRDRYPDQDSTDFQPRQDLL